MEYGWDITTQRRLMHTCRLTDKFTHRYLIHSGLRNQLNMHDPCICPCICRSIHLRINDPLSPNYNRSNKTKGSDLLILIGSADVSGDLY